MIPYIRTQKELRSLFWSSHPSIAHQAREAGTRSKRQNQQCATVRLTWCDYVERMRRNGDISEALAQRATL